MDGEYSLEAALVDQEAAAARKGKSLSQEEKDAYRWAGGGVVAGGWVWVGDGRWVGVGGGRIAGGALGDGWVGGFAVRACVE